jgi:hypothetical protein
MPADGIAPDGQRDAEVRRDARGPISCLRGFTGYTWRIGN